MLIKPVKPLEYTLQLTYKILANILGTDGLLAPERSSHLVECHKCGRFYRKSIKQLRTGHRCKLCGFLHKPYSRVRALRLAREQQELSTWLEAQKVLPNPGETGTNINENQEDSYNLYEDFVPRAPLEPDPDAIFDPYLNQEHLVNPNPDLLQNAPNHPFMFLALVSFINAKEEERLSLEAGFSKNTAKAKFVENLFFLENVKEPLVMHPNGRYFYAPLNFTPEPD